MIFIHHLLYSNHNIIYNSIPKFLQNLVENSFGAVTIFFVLSGFVITYQSINQSINYRNFLINRFTKLYPLYFLGVLFSFALSESKKIKDLFLNLFFLQTAIPGTPFNSQVYNLPGWSLCAEFLFYLSFPILFLILRKTSGYLIISISILCNFIYCTSFTYLAIPPNEINLVIRPFAMVAKIFVNHFETSQQWVSYFNPYVKIFDFATGMGVAIVFAKLKKPKHLIEFCSNIIICCIILYIILTPKLMNNYYGADLLFQILGLFILVSILSKSKRVIQKNNQSSKVFNLLGASTYAFYILQYEIINLFVTYFKDYSLLVNSLLAVIFIALYTLFSVGCFLFFQKPISARFSISS